MTINLKIKMHKKIRNSIHIVFISSLSAWSVILPPERRITWQPGVPGGIPENPVNVNIMDFGAAGDGVTDDYLAFTDAMESLPSGGGVLFIPEGTYMINSTITIGSGVVLRGAGYDRTHLLFDLGGQAANCFEMITYQRGEWVDCVSGYTKGSKEIVVADGSSFSVGDFVEIQQENDSAKMYTLPEWDQTWALEAVGQINTVAEVSGNTLTLDRDLYIDYDAELNPVIRTQGFVTYAGVERLHITKMDTVGEGSIFYLKNAACCWVREVESEHTRISHVSTTTVFASEFRDSYFHHSYDYGGGGHGYGVSIGFHTTDCLVENNIFHYLRHAMLAQCGACGNVFGYNYSVDPVQGEGETNLNDGWTPDDISLHGHYAYMNLFESNSIVEAGIGDYWGPSGPGNTLFRNVVRDDQGYEGIYIQDYTHGQNIIGNVLGSGRDTLYIESTCENTIVHGNFQNGVLSWDAGIEDHILPFSYYLTEKPEFLGDKPWPLLGSDINGEYTLPAQDRFESGEFVLESLDRIMPDIRKQIRLDYIREGVIEYCLSSSTTGRLVIFDSRGSVVQSVDLIQKRGRVDIRENGHIVPGVYYASIVSSKLNSVLKFIVLR